ncbi:MAG: PCP reductase family protein [Nitrospinae bacterium]|nr:PCP reductase family protein [Nitrospinota bacterium]
MTDLSWTAEAEEKLKKVPIFVRHMVKGMMEEYARERGASEITPALMDEARSKAGM